MGAKTTRQRFLDSASELFQRQGYSGTGLAEITERSGAPKGSLYHHFPGGKEQLAEEALELAGRRLRRGIEAALASAPDGPSAVRALAAMLAAGLKASGYELGCPVATTTLDAATGSTPIARAADRAFTSWVDSIAAHVGTRKAVTVLSALEGALILARAARSTDALEIVGEELAAYVA